MTINTDLSKEIYDGNGVTTVFPFGFKIFVDSDLEVTLIDADGVETLQVLNTDYTVDNAGFEAGGSITLAVAPPAGTTVLIKSAVPYTQPADYKNQGRFFPETHEDSFDRATRQILQLKEQADRSFSIPAYIEGVSTDLPAPEAGTVVGWDGDGTGLRNYTASTFVTSAAYSNFVADVFTPAAAATQVTLSQDPGATANLDVSIDGVVQVPGIDYTLLGTTVTFATAFAGTERVLIRYGTAIAQAITAATGLYYTPPSTGVQDTIAAYLDDVDGTGVLDIGLTNFGLGLLLDGTAAGAAFNQSGTGQHFGQNGARIHRLNDRLFLGAATANDGLFPNVARDWMSDEWVTGGFGTGPMASAIFGLANNSNPNNAIGVLSAIRSKDFTSAGTTAIPIFGCAWNDNTSLATKVYAGYFEAHRTATSTGVDTYGMEINTRVSTATIAADPYTVGDVMPLRLAAGAEWSATGQYDASCAIQTAANPMKFKKGIVFQDDSLVDLGSGIKEAIALPSGALIRQWVSAGNPASYIYFATTVAAASASLQLANGTFKVTETSTGSEQFRVTIATSAVNYLNAKSSTTGNPLELAAGGSDANIDLQLTPKGTGNVRFGTYSSTGDVACNGYITIKDAAGNTRKLMTTA